MKKNNLYFSALVLILGLSFTNCHSSSDNSLYQTNALLLNYVNGLLAGNCAQVTKSTSSSSVVTYAAAGYNIPSGGCNSSTLGSTYYTSSSSIITVSDAYFDSITTNLEKYPACTFMASVIKGSTSSTALNTNLAANTLLFGSVKTTTTSTVLDTLRNANTADSSVGPKNCYTLKITPFNTIGVNCTAASDVTTAQANIGYYVVNSIPTDMAANAEGNRDILKAARAILTSSSTSYDTTVSLYTPTAITAMRLMTSAELSTFQSTANKLNLVSYALMIGLWSNSSLFATLNALSSGAGTSCAAALTTADSTLKDYLIRIPATQYITNPNLNSNILTSEKLAVTTPLIPSLSCVYGNTAVATTTSATLTASTAAVGLCPSTYTRF